MRNVIGLMTAVAILGSAACDDDVTAGDPAMALVAGEYSAEGAFGTLSFTTETGGEETDWLDQGASILLDLDADGTTEGRVFIPGVDEDGGDFDEDLAGTWSLDDDVVTLDHDADTFLRDTPFVWVDGRLSGEETFSGTTIRVVLERR